MIDLDQLAQFVTARVPNDVTVEIIDAEPGLMIHMPDDDDHEFFVFGSGDGVATWARLDTRAQRDVVRVIFDGIDAQEDGS